MGFLFLFIFWESKYFQMTDHQYFLCFLLILLSNSLGSFAQNIVSPYDSLFLKPTILENELESPSADIFWGSITDENNQVYHTGFDEMGQLIYSEKGVNVANFQYHPQVQLFSYYETASESYIVMNRAFERIDTITSPDGKMDTHEFVLLENDHKIILLKDLIQMDLSDILTEADTARNVIHFKIQKLNENNEVYAEWKSIDHFDISDANAFFNFPSGTAPINFIHINSIEVVNDSVVVLSSRQLSEVTKIDLYQNEVIWRMGGTKNEFTFVNDDIGFAAQHDARFLSNGHLTLFDNGNYHEPSLSSVVEYELDEENKVATLINRFYGDTPYFATKMGNAQSLPNGNMLIGWGSIATAEIAASEVNEMDETIWSCSVGNKPVYRLQKHPFQSAFMTSSDSLLFAPDSTSLQFFLHNNSDNAIEINGLHFRTTAFNLENELPFEILSGDSTLLTLTYLETTFEDEWKDMMTLYSDTENRKIGHQIRLFTQQDSLNVMEEMDTTNTNLLEINELDISIAPNPAQDFLQLSFEKTQIPQSLLILNTQGQVISIYTSLSNPQRLSIGALKSGIYYVQMQFGGYKKIERFLKY